MFLVAKRKKIALMISVSMAISNFSYADSGQIVPDGRTVTTIVETGTRTDVTTATISGDSAFNSFSKFDVYSGNTANLYLPDGTSNLINVIRDERTDIDGILNSFKNGRIGGNVYFLNPHGVVVGSGGVVNVGALSVATPAMEFLDDIIDAGGNINTSVLGAILDGNIPLDPAGLICVSGTVNAMDSIDLAAGSIDVSGKLLAAKALVPGFDYDVPVNMADLTASGVVVKGGRVYIVALNDADFNVSAPGSVSPSIEAADIVIGSAFGRIGRADNPLRVRLIGDEGTLAAWADGLVNVAAVSGDLRVKLAVSITDDVILDALDGSLYVETVITGNDVRLAAAKNIIGTGSGVNVTGNSACLIARDGRIDVDTSLDTVTLDSVKGIALYETDGLRVVSAKNTGTGDVGILAHAGNLDVDSLEQNKGDLYLMANGGTVTNTSSVVNDGDVTITAVKDIANTLLSG